MNRRHENSIVKYFKETAKNKIGALGLIGIAAVPMILDHDGTFMIFALIVAIPMFFAKESWML